jgi:CheY-like chemotaxis protein
MPKHSILVATANKKAVEYITAFFQDTESIPTIIRAKGDLPAIVACQPDYAFIESDWADKRTVTRLDEIKGQNSAFRCFGLGRKGNNKYQWDKSIEFPLDDKMFRKALYATIQFPDPVKLVAVDDEKDVLEVIQEYFEGRRDPSFQVRTAPNGLDGFKLIEDDAPHCVILDLKMPVRSGVELYRDIRRSTQKVPVIIYIDSTATEDITEIRKWGIPVFVEKGGSQSSMTDMLALVKKLVAFA